MPNQKYFHSLQTIYVKLVKLIIAPSALKKVKYVRHANLVGFWKKTNVQHATKLNDKEEIVLSVLTSIHVRNVYRRDMCFVK